MSADWPAAEVDPKYIKQINKKFGCLHIEPTQPYFCAEVSTLNFYHFHCLSALALFFNLRESNSFQMAERGAITRLLLFTNGVQT